MPISDQNPFVIQLKSNSKWYSGRHIDETLSDATHDFFIGKIIYTKTYMKNENKQLIATLLQKHVREISLRLRFHWRQSDMWSVIALYTKSWSVLWLLHLDLGVLWFNLSIHYIIEFSIFFALNIHLSHKNVMWIIVWRWEKNMPMVTWIILQNSMKFSKRLCCNSICFYFNVLCYF